MPASPVWHPQGDCVPKTLEELRPALKALAQKRKGKQLIADKFNKDHIFSGHRRLPLPQLASLLTKYRNQGNLNNPAVPRSTYLISLLDKNAQDEVLNWIARIATNMVTFNNGRWTINTRNSAVTAMHTYEAATMDVADFKALNPQDRETKYRKWLTVGMKRPEIACQFDEDGTPLIYHFNF